MMATAPDGISEERLCRFLGINRQTAQAWRRRRLHKGGQKGRPYSELDAIVLTALAALFDVLPPSDVPVAWLQIRDELAERIPDRVDLVFDPRELRAELADSRDELARLTRIERPVVVVRIGERVQGLRETLRLKSKADAEFAERETQQVRVDRARRGR